MREATAERSIAEDRQVDAEVALFDQALIRVPMDDTGERSSIGDGDGDAFAARLVQQWPDQVGTAMDVAEPVIGWVGIQRLRTAPRGRRAFLDALKFSVRATFRIALSA